MIKAVLFDMDGVLIEAKDWHYEALNRALALFGLAIDRDAHLATFDGLPTRRKLEMLSRTRNLPVALHSFINEIKQEETVQITYASCKPVFHHRYALAELKKDGLRLGVCSNSIRQTIDLMMRLSGLSDFLDLTISNEDVARSKPDPEMYNNAISQMGLSPTEVLILEDNDHGIAAARASGAHVLVIGTTNDVTYQNIRSSIDRINEDQINAG
ncbi:HAD family hydrolase [Brevundimonas sp.]|uniref:HAD family hydrolase n=1 Tax=Brevundimonas sp. TaxID=1871086 RepID=UPI003D0D6181